ncbi:glycosyltransferase involved in cell wall biosynthesis [Actinomycetospora succinea]|uniref:Glycosyltransferase involved in cell wall biosynthesis n=3 Tax=Actinomycetospora succinea TaxID=663603 RepID=A0A4R6UNW2_9PSEU|nr:glycosyltransferase involved in cell wall biosynthesis [Actinomycetospora succinea]
MKVVSVMTTHAAGGAEFASIEMLDALAEDGHETVVLTNRPDLGRGTRVTVRSVDLGPKLSVRSWRALVLKAPKIVLELREALRREAPFDVLLVHYKKEQLLAALLPRRVAPRIVWAEWGPVPYPLRRGLPRLLYLAAARRAAAVLAISEGTRQSVTDVGVPAEKVTVVPNVMRTDELGFTAAGRARVRLGLGIPDDAFVVGCVSRFHPKKRNDVVVDAVAALDDPRVHLLLAGDGETEFDLRARGRVLGERLHIVPTPGDDVADVLSATDVSVFCPSPTEGAPRAVILAMLAGRACVSTGREGVHDLIPQDGGRICSPENDVEALRGVLAEYRDDLDLRERHGARVAAIAHETYERRAVARRAAALLGQDRGPLVTTRATGSNNTEEVHGG